METKNPNLHTAENDPNVIACVQDGVSADEIQLIDCPYCGGQSYYSGGFTSGCTWCGRAIAKFSDDAYTLSDSWGGMGGDLW